MGPFVRRTLLRAFAPLAVWALIGAPAFAEKRVALVIGNSEYESTPQLPNPVNDARAVAQLLSTVGFEVVSAANLGRDDMRQVVGDFVARVAAAGSDTIALVFYAGHGLQVEGENFLVPVDARLTSETDVPDQALRLLDVMKALEQAPARMRIVILDACRNNPFSAIGDAGGRGLAMVDAPAGSIVAYSTAPGTEAQDGKGRHSPYAAAFMRNVKRPNLPIEQFFKKVRLLVNETTDGAQTPWESSSLTADFTFIGPEVQASAERPPEASPGAAAPPVATPPAAAPVPLAELRARPVREAYEIVVEEDRVEYYEEFVRLYPDDPLCDRIRRLLGRRQQMIAWHRTVQQNSRDAYQSFAQRFPGSELSRTAQRLQERPRLVSLPAFEARPPIVVRPLPNRPPFGGSAGNPRPGGPFGNTGNPRPGGPVVGIPNGPRPGGSPGGNPGRPGPVVNNTPTGPIVVNPNGPRPGGPGGGTPGTPQQGGTPNTPRPGGPVANNGPGTPTPGGPIVVNPNGPRPGGPVGNTTGTPRPGGPVANNNPAAPRPGGPIVVNPNGPRPGGPVGSNQAPQRPGPVVVNRPPGGPPTRPPVIRPAPRPSQATLPPPRPQTRPPVIRPPRVESARPRPPATRPAPQRRVQENVRR